MKSFQIGSFLTQQSTTIYWKKRRIKEDIVREETLLIYGIRHSI
jgi:hypothetical protein